MDKKKKYKQPNPAAKKKQPGADKSVALRGYKRYALPAVAALVVLIVYLPSLQGGFVWDDDHYIQNNPLIHSFNLKALFSTYVMGNYHPLTMLIYTIEYHFWGLHEKGYHAVNLVIHLLNVSCVFYAVLLISGLFEIAFVAALLFGVHPMHVESVAWASELKDLLYTFFFLTSYICYLKYLKSNRRKYYFICLLLFILSLFSKGMAVCMPVLLILTDYFLPYIRRSHDIQIRKMNTRVWLEKLPFLLLSVTFGVIAVFAQKSTEAMQSETSYLFAQRIIIACYGFISYILKLIAPLNLCAYYPYPIKGADIEIPFQYYICGILFLLLAAAVYYSYRFTKKIAFGIGFFLITIFLVLQFLPVGGALMADRYSYLSSVGIFYLAGEGFYWLWNRKKALLNSRMIASVLLLSIVFFFSIRTRAMCEVWKNSMNLWSDVISQYQTIPYAYNNRGVLFMTDNPAQAINDFSNAIKIKADYPEALNNRGVVLMGQNRNDEALADFNNAIAAKPGYAEAYNHRGLVFEAEKQFDKALADFNMAVEMKPDFSKAYYNRGTFYISQSKYDEALSDYNKAIELDPTNTDAYNNRGNLLSILKRNDEAISDYNKIIEINPDNINAYFNRGTQYMNQKRNDDALRDFSRVIELQPNSPNAYYNRGLVENNAGNKQSACMDFKKAADLGNDAARDLYGRLCQ